MSNKLGEVVNLLDHKVYAVVADNTDAAPCDPCNSCAFNPKAGHCAYAPDFGDNDCVQGGFHYEEVE
jgi:hypothetical protein